MDGPVGDAVVLFQHLIAQLHERMELVDGPVSDAVVPFQHLVVHSSEQMELRGRVGIAESPVDVMNLFELVKQLHEWTELARGLAGDVRPLSQQLPKPDIDGVLVITNPYLILDDLPAESDSRVKALDVGERSSGQCSDTGSLVLRIQELNEATVPRQFAVHFRRLSWLQRHACDRRCEVRDSPLVHHGAVRLHPHVRRWRAADLQCLRSQEWLQCHACAQRCAVHVSPLEHHGTAGERPGKLTLMLLAALMILGAGRPPRAEPDDSKEKYVFVKTLTGKTITVHVDVSRCVDGLKESIYRRTWIPACLQCLTFEGRTLAGDALLSLPFGATVHLTLQLPGGASMGPVPSSLHVQRQQRRRAPRAHQDEQPRVDAAGQANRWPRAARQRRTLDLAAHDSDSESTCASVFVGGIPRHWTQAQVSALGKRFGRLRYASVFYDDSQRQCGAAKLTYSSPAQARLAVSELADARIEGCVLRPSLWDGRSRRRQDKADQDEMGLAIQGASISGAALEHAAGELRRGMLLQLRTTPEFKFLIDELDKLDSVAKWPKLAVHLKQVAERALWANVRLVTQRDKRMLDHLTEALAQLNDRESRLQDVKTRRAAAEQERRVIEKEQHEEARRQHVASLEARQAAMETRIRREVRREFHDRIARLEQSLSKLQEPEAKLLCEDEDAQATCMDGPGHDIHHVYCDVDGGADDNSETSSLGVQSSLGASLACCTDVVIPAEGESSDAAMLMQSSVSPTTQARALLPNLLGVSMASEASSIATSATSPAALRSTSGTAATAESPLSAQTLLPTLLKVSTASEASSIATSTTAAVGPLVPRPADMPAIVVQPVGNVGIGPRDMVEIDPRDAFEIEDPGSDARVADLKAAIAARTGAATEVQRLMVRGRVLEDEAPLAGLGLDGCRVFLAVLLSAQTLPPTLLKVSAASEASPIAQAERQRAAEAESQRALAAEQQRLAQAERQRAAEAERQRALAAEQQRLAQAEQQCAAEAERQRALEARQQCLAQAERQRAAEAEAERQREAEAEVAAKSARHRGLEQSMQICVKTLAGNVTNIDIEASDTIADVKLEFQNKEGTPPEKQKLIFGGQQLEDSRTLADYGIKQGATIYVVMALSCRPAAASSVDQASDAHSGYGGSRR